MVAGHLDVEQSPEFAHRLRMIIDVDVDIPVVVRVPAAGLPNNQDGCGLAAAAVAAGFITGLQSSIELLRKLVVRAFECLAHGLDNMRPYQNIPLSRPRRTLPMSFPILRAVAGEDRDIPFGVHDRDLPSVFPW